MTKHAQDRCQQRCINKLMLEMLFIYGEDLHQRDGAIRTTLTKRGYAKLKKDFALVSSKIERMKNLFVIESEEGDIITTEYQERHIKR